MSSNPPPAASSSKASAPAAPQSPAQNQSVSATVHFFGQQRGSLPFKNAPTPRNNQPSKKQNKGSKKFRQSDEDSIAESVSAHARDTPRVLTAQLAMRPFSNRKGQTSITHLMNFNLPPRPQNHHPSHAHGRSYRRAPTWGVGSGYHATDKARYAGHDPPASTTDSAQICARQLPLHCRSAR